MVRRHFRKERSVIVYIRLIGILLCLLSLNLTAEALDHQIGLSGGTALLNGDNTTSDTGTSVGLRYELTFKPALSIGLESIYQHVKGESLINDSSSIFYGPHAFDTKLLIMGLFSRVRMQYKIFQPYISVGTGGSMWFPGENDDRSTLPVKKKISWSTSPFASLGTGIAVKIGQNWTIDIGAKGFYFFSDELDNVDGRYVTGRSSMNDYTMQAGITIVYLIGREAESETERIPGAIEILPEFPVQSETVTEEESPVLEDTGDLKKQELVPAPETPETVMETEEKVEEAVPDATITVPPPAPAEPVITEEPEITTPPPSVRQRAVRRNFLVHVESFPTIDSANSRAATLREMGYQTQVTSVDRGEIGIWFRVYVGPYSIRSEAERVAERLIELGLSDYAAVIESEE